MKNCLQNELIQHTFAKNVNYSFSNSFLEIVNKTKIRIKLSLFFLIFFQQKVSLN